MARAWSASSMSRCLPDPKSVGQSQARVCSSCLVARYGFTWARCVWQHIRPRSDPASTASSPTPRCSRAAAANRRPDRSQAGRSRTASRRPRPYGCKGDAAVVGHDAGAPVASWSALVNLSGCATRSARWMKAALISVVPARMTTQPNSARRSARGGHGLQRYPPFAERGGDRARAVALRRRPAAALAGGVRALAPAQAACASAPSSITR
jgi:hypothetical protein